MMTTMVMVCFCGLKPTTMLWLMGVSVSWSQVSRKKKGGRERRRGEERIAKVEREESRREIE